MKIITWNINGLRSAEKDKHLTKLIKKYDPDVLCLQEIKMNELIYNLKPYNLYCNFAQKKGYSGVAVFTKDKPIKVLDTFGISQFDKEGRFLLLEFEKYIIINIYVPHGGRKKENHPYKFEVLDQMIKFIKTLKKPIYLCGDFNVAHTEKDVKNYKTNRNNNMFTVDERSRIDTLLKMGFLDTFRILHDDSDVYSMWPNGFDARKRNMGWRIDYIFASTEFASRINTAEYLKDIYGSDHCPYILEINHLKENKKMEYIIREAKKNDAKEIAIMKKKVWDTTYTGIYSQERLDNYDYEKNEKLFINFIESSTHALYVAEYDKKIVGFIILGFPQHPYGDYTYEISQLYILKEHQRKGIGKRLWDVATTRISEWGVNKFFINCNKYNTPAQHFYEALGGIVIHIDEDTEDDMIRHRPQITYHFDIK